MVATSTPSLSTTTGWFLQGQVPPDGHLMRLPIPHGRFQVGRRPDVNLSLPHPSVSKLHAEFIATELHLLVRDLGSTNGTFVNGIRVCQQGIIQERDIVQFAGFEFVVGRVELIESGTTHVSSMTEWMQTLTQFHKLMTERALVPHFQPIIQLTDGQTIGYEILARSILPGMASPRDMFTAAERTNLAEHLSVLCRQTGIEVAQRLAPTTLMFLNTHPSEHVDAGLLKSLRELRLMAPHQPIVLELHEGAITEPRRIAELRDDLLELNMGLAFDDFGAGQSRLQELAEVAPDYLKFDMSLIRDIHLSAQREQIVSGLVRMALDMNIQTLAEGIENVEEANICRQIGFTHAQGYFFGKPMSNICCETE
jgi:EAL domain-containing protein (putative c-di-GMP-specific phosphodiesterase class I)